MKIIFTDLDGTLLDHDTYSYIKALPALKKIKKLKIPLIICTSKTKAEIEYYRKELKNNHPFIAENGGGIFIPKNYFNFKFPYSRKDNKYYIIEFNKDYRKLKNVLKKIKSKYKIKSFLDMSAKELSKDSNLPLFRARLAKKRIYDIPFKIFNNEKNIIKIIKKNKLRYDKGGRYSHILGNYDKGKAVKKLIFLYKRKYKKIKTIALGDSENDFPMLKAVDIGYLVQKINKGYASDKFKKVKGIGPIGWNKTILSS